jgi:hypothetical protein
MTSRVDKKERMEIRRKIGSRALPDPAGPQPRAKGPRYLTAHACFSCRLSFKRASRSDGTTSACPTCNHPLSEMGRGFKAPPRRNLDSWKTVQRLYLAGFRFPSTARREMPALPTKLRDVERFLAANQAHPYRLGAT